MRLSEFLETAQAATAALTRIAVALESLTAPPPTAEPAPPPICAHPPESRIDFGMTQGMPDWECGICHFRTVAP